MRYRKRIKIAKGISLNLSGSGASVTLGAKGASVNIGKKGAYLNTSIPGLGLYSRQKIGNSSTTRRNNYSNTAISNNSFSEVNVKVSLDEKGKPLLQVFSSSGVEIFDEKIIRKVKRDYRYKESIEKLSNEKRIEIESNNKNFIEIYKLTPALIKKEDVEKKLQRLKPQTYKKKSFNEPIPLKEEIIDKLETESKKIKSFFFWKNRKLREDYITQNIESRFISEMLEWESKKSTFEKNQLLIEEQKNKEFEEEYLFQKSSYEAFLFGDDDFINSEIERIVSEIVLPVNFSMDYDYESNNLFIDLDLPEIEDMPKEKVNILSSGNISIKEKIQKELRYEYATCVLGIAFYFSALFYNITANIHKILISGYTQRLSRKTGNIEDDYVYSIYFERETFEKINIKNICPIEAVENFEHIMNISSTYELKAIKPFEKSATHNV